jgi:K+-transporting ATPase KdpF subunit
MQVTVCKSVTLAAKAPKMPGGVATGFPLPSTGRGIEGGVVISRAASRPFLPVSAPSGVPAEHLTLNTFLRKPPKYHHYHPAPIQFLRRFNTPARPFNYAAARTAAIVHRVYERLDLSRNCSGLLSGQRFIRPRLRQTLIMENLIVGGISVLLFLYLVVAMLRPEKF